MSQLEKIRERLRALENRNNNNWEKIGKEDVDLVETVEQSRSMRRESAYGGRCNAEEAEEQVLIAARTASFSASGLDDCDAG